MAVRPPGRLQAAAAKGDVQLMNRCAVARCGGAAWTKWLGYDLCKECSEAAWVWNTTTMTADEAAEVLTRIAKNLRRHGTGISAKNRSPYPWQRRKCDVIRRCDDDDLEVIYEIINDAARAYAGVIPADLWREPYMSRDELRREITAGVEFWGYEEGGGLVGVMGIQDVQDVTLIRHSYVRTRDRNQGIGGKLLSHLRRQTSRPLLIGTWADASWAIRFYEGHGFRLVSPEEKDRLLRAYWPVPPRQIQESVVLGDQRSSSIISADPTRPSEASRQWLSL